MTGSSGRHLRFAATVAAILALTACAYAPDGSSANGNVANIWSGFDYGGGGFGRGSFGDGPWSSGGGGGRGGGTR
jgi:hypothetical protein